jgi:hypothetical protein
MYVIRAEATHSSKEYLFQVEGYSPSAPVVTDEEESVEDITAGRFTITASPV